MQYKMELSEKQAEAANHLARSKRGVAWWKVGEGKTRISLEWMLQLNSMNPLVICSPDAFRQWQDEIELVGLTGVVRPSFFSSGMLSSKRGNKLLSQLLAQEEAINCVVVDELWMYKNIRSQRSELLSQLTKQFPTIGLSGSMITARNIEDLYGQAAAIGLAKKISPNLTLFRQEFCIEVKDYTGFLRRYPKKNAVRMIQDRLKDHVHIYFPKEVREIRDIPLNVDATTEQKQIKSQLVKEYYYEHGAESDFQIEIKSGAALLSKLLQVSDGFIYNSTGDSLSITSNKLRKLIHLCSELIDAGERVLVWFGFRQSIKEALERSPFETCVLYSDEDFDAAKWKSGRAKVCYATIGSGASLNDFKDVRYSIIYSTVFSYRALQQARGRTNRKSSQHSICYYYYFQTVSFPDAAVYRMLADAENTEQFVISTTRRVIQEYVELCKQPVSR